MRTHRQDSFGLGGIVVILFLVVFIGGWLFMIVSSIRGPTSPKPEPVVTVVTDEEILALKDLGIITRSSHASGGFLLIFGGFDYDSSTKLGYSYVCYTRDRKNGNITLRRLPSQEWKLREVGGSPSMLIEETRDWFWRSSAWRPKQAKRTQVLCVPKGSIVRGFSLDAASREGVIYGAKPIQ